MAIREEISIGISACLLGERVRYDGGHKRSAFVVDTLARLVRFVPVCPEMEIGLGTPREAIHLVGERGRARLVGVVSGRDHTAAMNAHSRRRVSELERLDLSGYILKSGSPSCGMEGARSGRGMFAEELLSRLSLLPIEEEGYFADPKRRENFIERVFAYRRLRDLFTRRWTSGDLTAFHDREKTLLLAHDRRACNALGRLIADSAEHSRRQLAERYQTGFMAALRKTPKRNRPQFSGNPG